MLVAVDVVVVVVVVADWFRHVFQNAGNLRYAVEVLILTIPVSARQKYVTNFEVAS